MPAVTAMFWTAKALTTALGESTSDFLVHQFAPVPAVLGGFVLFCIALAVQLRARRYLAWVYWFAVAMVGIFGTMAADVLHVGFGVPYAVSTSVFAVVLAGVFLIWHQCEGTLSMHAIDTPRRELFYWTAVVSTFALGTAAGDLAAVTFHLGYLPAGVVFTAALLIPALGYRWAGLNAVFAFWFAYVLTRPVGASFADWLGKPTAEHGLGVGSGLVSLALAVALLGCVAHLARSSQLRSHD
ncbi:MAG: hypothetical protein ABI345_14360 [Jatrophihabitans sp.]